MREEQQSELGRVVHQTTGEEVVPHQDADSSPRYRVLFIDSELSAHKRMVPKLQSNLEVALGARVEIISCLSGKEAWQEFEKGDFQLVILDGDCPDGKWGSRSLFRKMKKAAPAVPLAIFRKKANTFPQDEIRAEIDFIYPISAKQIKEIATWIESEGMDRFSGAL